MKKLFFLLMTSIFCAINCDAQDALYIYHDGHLLDGFPLGRVDSIKYSCYDADSVYHKTWQMQDVYVRDTIYRIPLADIDSIAFRAPEVIYQKDVVFLQADEAGQGSLLSYVQSVDYDKHEFTLMQNTPESVYPTINDVVWLDSIQSPFDRGWSGRVIAVERKDTGVVVAFGHVEPYDIFEQLVCVGGINIVTDSIADDEVSQARRRGNTDYDHNSDYKGESNGLQNLTIGSVKIDFSPFIKILAPKLKHVELSLGLTPHAGIDYAIDVSPGRYYKVKYYHKFKFDFDFEIGLETKNALDKLGETEWTSDRAEFPPIKLPYGFYLQASVGAFFDFDLKGKIAAHLKFSKTSIQNIDFNSSDATETTPASATDRSDALSDAKGEGDSKKGWSYDGFDIDLNGYFKAWVGGFLDLGVGWGSPDIVEAGISFSAGPKLELSFNPSVFDWTTNTTEGVSVGYQALKDLSITASLHGGVSAYIILPVMKFMNVWQSERQEESVIGIDFLTIKYPMLPKFNTPRITKLGSSNVTVSCNMNTFGIYPNYMGIGIAKQDNPTEILRSSFATKMTDLNYTASFEGLMDDDFDFSNAHKFRIFPMVKLGGLGFELRADHYKDFSHAPALELEKVTTTPTSAKMQFHAGGIPMGKTENLMVYYTPHGQGGSDWQYWPSVTKRFASDTDIEHDIEIEIKDLVSGQYDFIATLYSYSDVYVEGNFTIEAGVTQSEWVDLGLPSGRLWASCNLGAEKIGDVGKYYAWAETTPYNPDSYLGAINHDIDDEHDAAFFASRGRMPRKEDFEELMEYCTWTWDKARKWVIVENNGNSIVFPMTGYYFNGSKKDKNVFYSWTRNYDPEYSTEDETLAWYFWAESDKQQLDRMLVENGAPIRPVKDK